MKHCPTCNRNYTDETLSFCLDDGTPLIAADQGSQQYDPQATLFMQNPPEFPTSQVQTRTTAGDTPRQIPENQPPSVQGHQQAPTIQSSSFGTPFQSPSSQSPPSQSPSSQSPFQTPSSDSPFQQPPTWQPSRPASPYLAGQKKKRSVLPWVIGAIVLLVGGGMGLVIVLAVIASMNGNENANNANNSNVVVNGNANNSNNSNESANTNENKNENNNTNTTPTSSLVKFVNDVHLSTSQTQGSATLLFGTTDIIYINFKVSSLPNKTKLKGVIEIVSLDESSDKVKPGDKVDALESFNANKQYNGHFKFTPGSTGWPKGKYKAEIYEVADDDTLSLISTLEFTVE